MGKNKNTTSTTRRGDFPRLRASSAQSLIEAINSHRVQQAKTKKTAMYRKSCMFFSLQRYARMPQLGQSFDPSARISSITTQPWPIPGAKIDV